MRKGPKVSLAAMLDLGVCRWDHIVLGISARSHVDAATLRRVPQVPHGFCQTATPQNSPQSMRVWPGYPRASLWPWRKWSRTE